MGYLTSGNEIVDAMGSINISGNIIPAVWYRTITKENGKPYLLAIVILADIVYWYRPSEVRDQGTGHILGWKKKFSDDLLRQSYQYYADLFGESKKTIKTAMDKLEKLQVIRREFRTVSYGDGLVCNNVMYVELKPDMLYQLTFPEEIPAMNGANNSYAGVSDDKMGGSLPTKSDTLMEILGGRGIPKGTQVSTNLDIGHDETDHTLLTKPDTGLSQNGDTYSYTSTNISDREYNHIRKREERKDRLHQNYLKRKASGAQKRYEDKIKKRKKAEIEAKKAAIRAEDIAKGVFVPVSSLPQREPMKGVQTA